MNRSDHAGDARGLTCRALTLPQVRALPRIPSGYSSDFVYAVTRVSDGDGTNWSLRPQRAARVVTKVYDDGAVDDWLDSYQEAAEPGSMRFIGAFRGEELLGLATWTHSRWNNTLWLADIRVRSAERRTGAGSRLMAQVKARAKSAGMRGIRVETQNTNYPAVQFYRRHGFVLSGIDDHLYTNADLTNGEVALFLFWERP